MALFTIQDIERIINGILSRLRKLEIQGNSGIIKTGIAADRPATPTTSPGTTFSYYAYDTKVFSVWNIDDEAWDGTTLS